MELLKIYQDVCDISKRIREVDEHYFIVFNRRLNRFELHDAALADSFACVLPFERLDERSVRHARRTRIERIERLLEELDRENER